MRRSLLLVVAALVIASCSSAPPPVTGPSVDTIFGPVTVPAAPQRVVAVGWGDAEAALAVGVQPVGASDWLGFGGTGAGPWAADRYTAPPTVLGTTTLDPESVAALRPDLILWTRSTNDETLYRTLSRIAPTVAAPPGVTTNYGTSWDAQAAQVAAALGRRAEGEQLVSGVRDRFAQARAAHPQWQGRSVAVGALNGDSYAAYVPGTLRVDAVESLGFRSSPAIARENPVNFAAKLGTENVSLLDADLTMVFLIGADAAQVRDNPLIQRLGSTRAGRLVVLDDPLISKAVSSGTALGLTAAIERIVPLVERAGF